MSKLPTSADETPSSFSPLQSPPVSDFPVPRADPQPDPQPGPEPAPPSLLTPDAAVFQPARRTQFDVFPRPNRTRLNLYILRHASAGTRRPNPKVDIKRPLDKEGKRHCLLLAHVLNGIKLSFDLIVSSPLKRCLQTAQLIGTETGYEAKILHAEALQPDATYAQFQRLVKECQTFENVLMVGHNPTLTNFLGQLINDAPADGDLTTMARLRLRKGSLARVSLERGPAVLHWMLDPRIVRGLYDTSTKSSRRRTSRK